MIFVASFLLALALSIIRSGPRPLTLTPSRGVCVCVGDNPLRASPQSVSCVSSVFLVANPLLEQPFAVMKTRTLHGERLPPVPQDWRTQERIRTDIPGFGRVGRHLACIDLQARDNRTDWTSSVDCSVTYGDNTSQQVNQLCLYIYIRCLCSVDNPFGVSA